MKNINEKNRLGVLDEDKKKLDYILSLKTEDFLERRLQTIIFKRGLAKSIHHARVLIFQRHIRVGKQIVNVPSFVVRQDSEKHISLAPTSSLAGTGFYFYFTFYMFVKSKVLIILFAIGRVGRIKKKKLRAEKKEEPAK